jgi:putative transcriptional regulator
MDRYFHWRILRRFVFRRAMLAVLVIVLALPALAVAAATEDGKPYFLVATPDLSDPVFERSVVLMLPPGQPPELVVGLIVNKPTDVEVKRLFPKAAALKGVADDAFLGGPVEPASASIVMRGNGAPSNVAHLLDDLYLVTDADLVGGLLENPKPGDNMRVIMGRAQWTNDQLHAEIQEGSWYTVPANVDMVFSEDPTKVWKAMVDRAQLLEVEGPRLPDDFTLLRCSFDQVPRGGSPAAR